ncbi:hypothetical protein [Thiomicrorhabdus lithotrophica]|uniref:Uncharacterized protein n=1 Tax=Thiomicrorhabdus lithotrophica TaxID=2949997 RepID=A0ABY8CDR0_9GAMM|nr:hypothetical protein [Thiomicrorhabdus lithotrophica]WEJ62563.1 hypothetical protein NR989_11195 [Thiomicrorhabdus lithotrophica]
MLRARQTKFQISIYALSFALLLSLSGCFGITQPSDDDVTSMATEYFNQEFDNLFKAEEVLKQNGYKQNDTHYVAELKIIATAQQSLEDYAKSIMNDSSLSSLEKITNSMAIGLFKITLPEFTEGDQIEFDKNYLFIKTDNGWLLKKELQPEDQL